MLSGAQGLLVTAGSHLTMLVGGPYGVPESEPRFTVCNAFFRESANVGPHYHKLCSVISHIRGNRKGQHIRNAMDEPRPEEITFVIMISPLPDKYPVGIFSMHIS